MGARFRSILVKTRIPIGRKMRHATSNGRVIVAPTPRKIAPVAESAAADPILFQTKAALWQAYDLGKRSNEENSDDKGWAVTTVSPMLRIYRKIAKAFSEPEFRRMLNQGEAAGFLPGVMGVERLAPLKPARRATLWR